MSPISCPFYFRSTVVDEHITATSQYTVELKNPSKPTSHRSCFEDPMVLHTFDYAFTTLTRSGDCVVYVALIFDLGRHYASPLLPRRDSTVGHLIEFSISFTS